jgi:TonB family protein
VSFAASSPDDGSPDGILAQHSISRPGSLDPNPPFSASGTDADVNLLELPEIALPEQLAAVATEPVPSISADLLNDIVERARISTNASDAAIALRHGEDLICFATTGTNAPDIGVRLDLNSGLSGACVQSRKFQRCDDSENDSRVEAALCRRLGMRSVLVYPIIRRDELLGVVEVFSAQANAFGDREVQSLAALSRTIGYILDRPQPETAAGVEESAGMAGGREEIGDEESASHPEALPAHNFGRSFETIVDHPEMFPVEPELAEAERKDDIADVAGSEISVTGATPNFAVDLDGSHEPAGAERAGRRPDSYSPMLTVAVIALAVALGWLLGEGVEHQNAPVARNTPPQAAPAASQPAPSPAAVMKPAEVAPPTANKSQATATAKKHESAPATREGDTAATPDELVVSQNGKVIYRQESQAAASHEPAAASGTAGVSSAAMVSSETPGQWVVKRVEPEYPELARAERISGPVTLEAIVARDGSVKTLKTISGDPQLAAAARQAVSQWQFKPFTRQGKPAEFQTDVTINFRLPE